MSAEGQSFSFFSTSRRSACDRCRKQKLRCPPRENATQSCLRCIRASLPCTTGYLKPLGRSGGDGVVTSSHNDAEPAAVSNLELAEEVPGCMDMTPLDLESSPSTATTFGSTSSWILPGSLNDDQPLAQGWSQTPAQDEASNNFFGSYMHEPLLSGNLPSSSAQLSNIENRNDTLSNDFDRLLSAPTPSEPSSGKQMPHADFITKQQQRARSSSSDNVLSGAECDIRLSQLSLDLSRQMQELLTKSQRGNTTGKDNGPSGNPFEVTNRSSGTQSTSNSFGDALRSTSEFLAILLCYENGGVGATSSAVSLSCRSRVNNDASGSSIGFACVLSLLSSYLRIIAIFDGLFHQLYELQRRNGVTSPELVAGLQTLPDLHLAGFPVQQGSLQTKILIQAIQHQFELIEKILGLPVELRISDRREEYYMGLLQNEWARTLLQAILNGQRGGEGADMFAFDRVRALDSLETLNENMMKVRQSLES